jgi:hypothetical protein
MKQGQFWPGIILSDGNFIGIYLCKARRLSTDSNYMATVKVTDEENEEKRPSNQHAKSQPRGESW